MLDADNAHLVARLERFCAALYRDVPLEGHGLLGQVSELAHAAELEAEAAAIKAGDERVERTVLTARDIRVACQLLIDVRRNPRSLTEDEVTLARAHFPEVEYDSLDELERVIGFYTGLLRTIEGSAGA